MNGHRPCPGAKRKTTLKRKAEELSILCGVPVAVICYNRDGTVDAWPDDKNKVNEILIKYADLQKLDFTRKNKTNQMIKDMDLDIPTTGALAEVYKTWNQRFEYLSEESLMEYLKLIEIEESNLQNRWMVLED